MHGIVSHTPRLKASSNMMQGSPILMPLGPSNMQRTKSVLDQEYDLMGLSRKNAAEESDWILGEHLDNSEPVDDDHLNIDLVKEHQGGFVDMDTALPHALGAPEMAIQSSVAPINEIEGDAQFFALPDNSYRNRSMTF